MLNDSKQIAVETNPTVYRDTPFSSEVRKALDGKPTMKLTFPMDVFQTDARVVEIPLVKASYNMFSTAFAEHVYEAFGTYEGDKFISEMTDMVTRRMLIAQIR
jgi:hypothetical protein